MGKEFWAAVTGLFAGTLMGMSIGEKSIEKHEEPPEFAQKVKNLPAEQKEVAKAFYDAHLNGNIELKDIITIEKRLVAIKKLVESARGNINKDQRMALDLLITANGEVDKLLREYGKRSENIKLVIEKLRKYVLEARVELGRSIQK